ncbi:MAG TPA: cytochrome P450 [Herpetosiphonaceae bacterium]
MTQTSELDLASSQSSEISLTSAEFKANPYPTFARLRACDPVYQYASSDDAHTTWLVTRYADAEMVLQDARFVKDRQHLSSPLGPRHPPSSAASPDDLFGMGLLSFDPPDHTRLRTLVNPFFTPRQLEQQRARIQAIADELIDDVAERGRMDLIEDFAFPLPMRVISEILGIPAEDRAQLHQWFKVIADVLDDPVAYQQASWCFQAVFDYVRDVIERKRQAPANDVITVLLEAEGEQISPRELVSMVFVLILTGHETTANLIGNGMLALMTHPEQLALIRDNPTLIKPAVEEFLRYHSPVTLSTFRWAREDIELGGKVIRRGDGVVVSLSSANRDETAFAQPDHPHLKRSENRHLAFGKGIHYCLGAPLARLEGQIAINTLVRRLPQLRLAVDPDTLEWRPGSTVMGVYHLPVVF